MTSDDSIAVVDFFVHAKLVAAMRFQHIQLSKGILVQQKQYSLFSPNQRHSNMNDIVCMIRGEGGTCHKFAPQQRKEHIARMLVGGKQATVVTKATTMIAIRRNRYENKQE